MTKRLVGFCLVSVAVSAVAIPVLFAAETTEKKPSTKQHIEIKCKVSMTNAAGNLDVVAAPTVVTVAGRPATIAFTDASGRTTQIELTGTMIQNSQSGVKVPAKEKE